MFFFQILTHTQAKYTNIFSSCCCCIAKQKTWNELLIATMNPKTNHHHHQWWKQQKQQQNHQEIMIMSFVFGGFEQKHTNRYSIHLHKYTKTRFDRQGKNQLKRQWQWYYWGPDAMAMAISQLDILFLSKYVYLSIYLFILIYKYICILF